MKKIVRFFQSNEKVVMILLPIIFFLFSYIFFFICERSFRGNYLGVINQFILDMDIWFSTGDFMQNAGSTILSLFGLIILILLITRIFLKNTKANISLSSIAIVLLSVYYIVTFITEPNMLINGYVNELTGKFFWSLRHFYIVLQYFLPLLLIYTLCWQLGLQISELKNSSPSKSSFNFSKNKKTLLIALIAVIAVAVLILFI